MNRKAGNALGPWGGPEGSGAAEIEAVLRLLAVEPGSVFVDAGCGGGRYALAAADRSGERGRVVAFDHDAKYLGALRREYDSRGVERMTVLRADMTQGLPVADGAADACLASGVLHMPQVWRALPAVMREFARVLRPGGRLGVAQRLMRDAPVGPPSPDLRARARLVNEAAACSLLLTAERDFGFTQLLVFQKG